jgi:hypothetical protein
MKRLPLCLLVLSAVTGHAVDLGIAWDPETNQNIIGAVDGSGVFHRRYGGDLELELAGYGDGGPSGERGELLRWDPAGGYYVQGKRWSWVTSGESCPGAGPYELLMHWDAQTENWIFMVLDGAGQLYTLGHTSWNPKGKPVPGPPPYQLSSAQDPKVAGVYPIALDGGGGLWFFDATASAWEQYPFVGAYEGAAPTDFLALTSQDIAALGDTYLFVIDETGRISRSTDTGWEDYARIPGGTAPYRLDGFVKSAADGAWIELRVLDGAGRLFLPRDGAYEPFGEPCGGTSPRDLAVYRMESRGTHMIFAVDSNGALYSMKPDGGWVTLCDSFR